MANVHIQTLGVLIFLGIIYCLQVIPERTNVTFFDPEYIEFGTLHIKRYGRKSPYYINLEGRIKHTWNNNITANLVFYEYLHNEYRRSFVEMHYKFCDLINKEPYIGMMLAKKGVICPAPPGEYHLLNMTILSDNFEFVFPFEKGRVNIEVTLTNTGQSIMRAYLNAAFKADIKKKNKS